MHDEDSRNVANYRLRPGSNISGWRHDPQTGSVVLSPTLPWLSRTQPSQHKEGIESRLSVQQEARVTSTLHCGSRAWQGLPGTWPVLV